LIKSYQLELSDERWIDFVESFPQANIFHHTVWANLIAECYGYRPFVIALIDEDNKICAGLPFLEVDNFLLGKCWVSLPYTDYCSPLFRDHNALENLTVELVRLSQDNHDIHIEVRWELQGIQPIQKTSLYVHHSLNLNRDIDSIIKSFHRTQRQNIKTAEKNDVVIKRGENIEYLHQFFQLHCHTRRRKGIPVQPWRFFEILLNKVIENGHGFVLLAFKDDQCLAAGLFLNCHQTLCYKYSASINCNQNLRPNHLLTWTAIRWGYENGFKIFDFGRTAIDDEGLRTYKNRWGAEEKPLPYSLLSVGSPRFSLVSMEPLMHKIIQNSPIWVCRLAGNLLYRHFG
jgi:lipid II:glycine glycyltransferase (peptidoglycan interpeptide bridge formation enzyme)